MKKGTMGMPTIGDAMFRNQFGVTGNNLSDNKKNIMLPSLPSNYIQYTYSIIVNSW